MMLSPVADWPLDKQLLRARERQDGGLGRLAVVRIAAGGREIDDRTDHTGSIQENRVRFRVDRQLVMGIQRLCQLNVRQIGLGQRIAAAANDLVHVNLRFELQPQRLLQSGGHENRQTGRAVHQQNFAFHHALVRKDHAAVGVDLVLCARRGGIAENPAVFQRAAAGLRCRAALQQDGSCGSAGIAGDLATLEFGIDILTDKDRAHALQAALGSGIVGVDLTAVHRERRKAIRGASGQADGTGRDAQDADVCLRGIVTVLW